MQNTPYAFCKRTFDIIYATCGIVLSAVPMACIAAAVKATSQGPVIFRQVRIGRYGEPFICYKIRTMKNGAPQCAAAKLKNCDILLTPVGRFLRQYSLDEMTQFMNVLRGDMSLIGPRPLIPEERELHRMRTARGVYDVRPGISGLSQVHGRDTLSERRKAHLDALYATHASVWLDLAILSRTLRCIRH